MNRTKQQINSPDPSSSIMDQQGNIQIDQLNYNKYISNNPTSLNNSSRKDYRSIKTKNITNQK